MDPLVLGLEDIVICQKLALGLFPCDDLCLSTHLDVIDILISSLQQLVAYFLYRLGVEV